MFVQGLCGDDSVSLCLFKHIVGLQSDEARLRDRASTQSPALPQLVGKHLERNLKLCLVLVFKRFALLKNKKTGLELLAGHDQIIGDVFQSVII